MPRKTKKQKGRPARKLPPLIDATPERMAQAMFALPADYQWQYEKQGVAVYLCVDCGVEVSYPETLYSDGQCEGCHAAVTV